MEHGAHAASSEAVAKCRKNGAGAPKLISIKDARFYTSNVGTSASQARDLIPESFS
jgi:hypothetical protein